MLFRKKFSFLIVLAVFFLIFAAGCDSGSNSGNEQTVVTTVETEDEFSGSLTALNSGEKVEITSDFGTDSSSFELDKESGTYSIAGTDPSSLKTVSGDLVIGNGSTIDVTLANLNFGGTLTVDIGSGDLDLNNVSAQRLEIISAGSESVNINENSAVEDIEIKGRGVRLVVNTDNEIGRLEIKAGADDAEVEKASLGAKIREAVVDGEGARFKDFKSGDFELKGSKTPDFVDSDNSDNDQDDSTSGPAVDLEKGYLNLYMSSEGSLNALQSVTTAKKPDQTGKPDDTGKPVTKEIDEVNVVIERIEFNNSDGSGWQEWEAFSGPQQVDLLSENLMEEFEVEGEAETGEFDSIRLYAAAEYDENLEEEPENEDGESDQTGEEEQDETATQSVISLETSDSTSSEDSITTDDSLTTEDSITTEDPIDSEDELEEDNYSGKSHLVYADGSKEELWVHAAAQAGIKIKGDFTVETGTETEVKISFEADQLINPRGPKVAPMLLPKAFKMQAEATKGALQVEIENFAEVEAVELLLTDSEDNEYPASEVEGEEGVFIFPKLEAGEYELSLEAEGYEPVTDSLTVTAGEKSELSYSLTEIEDESDQTDQTEGTEDPEDSEEE